MGLVLRSKMGSPVSCSSCRSIWLREGWLTNSFLAAAVMLPHSAMVFTYCACFRFINSAPKFVSFLQELSYSLYLQYNIFLMKVKWKSFTIIEILYYK